MKKAISHKQYTEATLHLEELLKVVDDNTPENSLLSPELIEVSDIIEQYGEIHFPIGLPTLEFPYTIPHKKWLSHLINL